MKHPFSCVILAFSLLGGLVCTDINAAVAEPVTTARDAEASMLVTGEIIVAVDGSVNGYSIDKREALPVPVAELIDRTAPAWRFEPVLVDGHAVTARANMSLRVLARRRGDGRYTLSIQGAHFGSQTPEQDLHRDHMVRPIYPQSVRRAGAGGTVYLLLKLDAAGHVADAVAEQTNLDVNGSAISMARWRAALERSAIAAARQWTFNTTAARAARASTPRYARAPVRYTLRVRGENSRLPYGRWDPYIPGPRRLVPWLGDRVTRSDSADAMPDDAISAIGSGLRLTTPLGGA